MISYVASTFCENNWSFPISKQASLFFLWPLNLDSQPFCVVIHILCSIFSHNFFLWRIKFRPFSSHGDTKSCIYVGNLSYLNLITFFLCTLSKKWLINSVKTLLTISFILENNIYLFISIRHNNLFIFFLSFTHRKVLQKVKKQIFFSPARSIHFNFISHIFWSLKNWKFICSIYYFHWLFVYLIQLMFVVHCSLNFFETTNPSTQYSILEENIIYRLYGAENKNDIP